MLPESYVLDPVPTLVLSYPVVDAGLLLELPRWLLGPVEVPVLPEWTGSEDLPEPYKTSSSYFAPGLLVGHG